MNLPEIKYFFILKSAKKKLTKFVEFLIKMNFTSTQVHNMNIFLEKRSFNVFLGSFDQLKKKNNY